MLYIQAADIESKIDIGYLFSYNYCPHYIVFFFALFQFVKEVVIVYLCKS
jgi:hypothetical protein